MGGCVCTEMPVNEVAVLNESLCGEILTHLKGVMHACALARKFGLLIKLFNLEKLLKQFYELNSAQRQELLMSSTLLTKEQATGFECSLRSELADLTAARTQVSALYKQLLEAWQLGLRSADLQLNIQAFEANRFESGRYKDWRSKFLTCGGKREEFSELMTKASGHCKLSAVEEGLIIKIASVTTYKYTGRESHSYFSPWLFPESRSGRVSRTRSSLPALRRAFTN